MTDRLERSIADVDRPRALDPAFRARLERAILDDTSPGRAALAGPGSRVGWAIDGPRELTPRFRARLEAALVRRPRMYPPFVTTVAAAVSVILIATGVMFVADRAGGPGSDAAQPVLPAPTTPPATPPTSPSKAKKVQGSLRTFKSASEFLGYVRKEALEIVGPYGIPGGGILGGGFGGGGPRSPGEPVAMPRAPSVAHSGTNIQETGVDEPDTVKTDGRRLVISSGSTLRFLDATSAKPRVASSLKVSDDPTGIFLAGNRVIEVSERFDAPPKAGSAAHNLFRSWTTVTVIDITDMAKPRIVSTFDVEGDYVGARLVRGVVRLVIRSAALGPAPVAQKGYSAKDQAKAKAANERKIRESFVGDWVPHYVLQRSGRPIETGHVLDWRSISRPPDNAGLGTLTVLTIDPADPRPDNAQSVVGAGQIVYASTQSLYVTSSTFSRFRPAPTAAGTDEVVTRIHRFDIRHPDRAGYVASGEVPGVLLNQFSLSEYRGHLRVASTTDFLTSEGASSSKSSVTVLDEKAGKLVSVGAVGNLAKGERIFSVRFVGSMGYVVTFRQIDPLFVIDIRKPSRPRVRGQLKIRGYSGYLHPLTETRILGVGRDASKTGTLKGVQLSLFDVSNPVAPRRIDSLVEGVEGYSTVEDDHHAFLYWEPRRLIVAPAAIEDEPDDRSQFVGALAVRVSPTSGFGDAVRLTHQGRKNAEAYTEIERSLVLGDRLLTVSDAGLLVSDLVTLDDRAWIPFES